MSYSCGKFKIGDKGQRYEVRFMSEGKDRVMGWTDKKHVAEAMKKSVNLHPCWENPEIIDRNIEPSTQQIAASNEGKYLANGEEV